MGVFSSAGASPSKVPPTTLGLPRKSRPEKHNRNKEQDEEAGADPARIDPVLDVDPGPESGGARGGPQPERHRRRGSIISM